MLETLTLAELAAFDEAMLRAQETLSTIYGPGLGFVSAIGLDEPALSLYGDVTDARRDINAAWFQMAAAGAGIEVPVVECCVVVEYPQPGRPTQCPVCRGTFAVAMVDINADIDRPAHYVETDYSANHVS